MISCKQLPKLKEKLITNWLPFELDEGQEAKPPGLVRLSGFGDRTPLGCVGSRTPLTARSCVCWCCRGPALFFFVFYLKHSLLALVVSPLL